jgi:dihydropteroate synthase
MDFSIGPYRYDGSRTLIMGILNVTPDSFSDGGRFFDHARAVDRAFEMAHEGADIIDIGGESTRPGSEGISLEEELERVIPVVEAIAPSIGIPVSIDTMKAGVAGAALDAGAMMVNDVSALGFDPHMAGLIASRGCSLALMHMRGEPRTMQDNPVYDDVVGEIYDFLKERIAFAESEEIYKGKLIVDPGVGFGKDLDHNLAILRGIKRFRELRCPVLVGPSRKRMIGMITGAPVEERDWGTAAISAWCAVEGVEILRVHNVKAMRQVCAVAEAVRG